MFLGSIPAQVQDSIQSILTALAHKTESLAVFLVDDNGFLIAEAGEINVDRAAVGALASAAFGAAFELAKILGEAEISTISHQGNSRQFLISKVGGNYILIIVYDSNVQLQFITPLLKPYSEQIDMVLNSIPVSR
jgi:predicted regulator of Ras-like GTPase activity (Roadblock/LC7/MglB family)